MAIFQVPSPFDVEGFSAVQMDLFNQMKDKITSKQKTLLAFTQ